MDGVYIGSIGTLYHIREKAAAVWPRFCELRVETKHIEQSLAVT